MPDNNIIGKQFLCNCKHFERFIGVITSFCYDDQAQCLSLEVVGEDFSGTFMEWEGKIL